jgi:hypothetical protein
MKYLITQLLLLLLLSQNISKKLIKQSTVDEEVNCIALNQQGFNPFGSNDYTIQPTDCTSLISSCCYARIKLNYGSIPIDNSYCFILTKNKDTFFKRVINKYTDELKWYAQQTLGMYEQYQTIGNNLNYTFYTNYTCHEQPNPKDFSSYADTHCALYDQKGVCTISNNEEYFDTFVKAVYTSATAKVCNTLDNSGNCIDPYNPSYQNNNALMPLLELMKSSLSIDSNVTNTTQSINKNKWPNACVPIPAVDIQLMCPDTFVSGKYISASLLLILLSIIFIFI